jgi:LysM repeat protein
MKKHWYGIILFALLLTTFSLLPLKDVSARPLPQESPPSPSEVIEAVNALRIANGLLPLNTHPVLMQIAQWEANAIANGAPGHTRPNGLTLGQWMLSLGYPLLGDLSLDGYRSENWIAAETAQQAIDLWLMDGPHTNTMLSPDRSDIGAAVAVSDQIYIVLETALQTNSGEMQFDAYPILTAIAQGGSLGDPDNLVPQYIIPVKRSTARPNGNVIHKVQYGQSLWSIAVTYNTTIDQIRAWNNLGESTEIYDGQILLVQMGATQPPPPTTTPKITATAFMPVTPTAILAFPTTTGQPTSTLSTENLSNEKKASPSRIGTGIVMFIALLVLILGLFSSWASTRSPKLD